MTDKIEFFEHPDYTANQSDWHTYQDLYDANHDVLVGDKYLIKHELECINSTDSNKIRAIRQARTRYTNLLEPIISRYTSIFFKEDPELDAATDALFGDDINDVTGTGKHLFSFLKDDVLKHLLLFGRPIVLTDAPPTVAISRADQVERKLTPTFEILHPLAVKDWEVETDGPRRGQFKQIRYEYEVIEPRMSLREQPKVCLYTKVFSFYDGSYKVERYKAKDYNHRAPANVSEWLPVDSYDYAGRPNMPIRSLFEDSWVKDTCQEILGHFNLKSTRDNIQLFQAHQRIYITGISDADQRKAMSEYTIGFLPENSTVQSVEPGDTSSIDRNIDVSLMNVFRVAFNQSRVMSSESKAVEGADTQAEGKEQLISLIVSEIQNLENLANQFIQDYAFYKESKKDFKGKITLAKDIKIEDIDSMISIYSTFRDEINRVPEWRKETLKQIVDVQQLPDSDKIKTAIDASSTLSTSLTTRTSLLESLGQEQVTEPRLKAA